MSFKGLKGQLVVEISIRCKVDQIPSWYKELMLGKEVFISATKFCSKVPLDWIGFKDGTMMKILTELGSMCYMALAYIVSNANEVAYDVEGNKLEGYSVVEDGRSAVKFVKKRMIIVSEDDGVWEASGVAFDSKYNNPVYEFLSIRVDKSKFNYDVGRFVRGLK